MLMTYPNWSVQFKMEFGHHPIAPVDLVLTCAEPDLEAVVRTLRHSGAEDIHITKDQPIPQIPEPPRRRRTKEERAELLKDERKTR